MSESRYLWTEVQLSNHSGLTDVTTPTIEEKLASAAERVGDVHQVRTSLRREGLCRRVAGARKQEVVLRTGRTQLRDDVLQRGCPLRDDQVVRLVHETTVFLSESSRCWEVSEGSQDDALVGAVLGSKLRPDGGELSVSRTSLADDLAIPTGVVVLVVLMSGVNMYKPLTSLLPGRQ